VKDTKNADASYAPGFASDHGVMLRWWSVDDGEDAYAQLRHDLGGAYDFTDAHVSMRVMREKRSTVVGFALLAGDDLVAEYSRRLLSRNAWVG